MEKDQEMLQSAGRVLKAIPALKPIVHCITNYVTVNGCANIVLACGASPIMAQNVEEVKEVAASPRRWCSISARWITWRPWCWRGRKRNPWVHQ